VVSCLHSGAFLWLNFYHATDIPSHNYQLSFAPSSEWPEFYATGAQIASYYQGIVRE
jgi:cation diffusion facilitator CzcD-associated flavoprotein CzcO